MRSNAAIEGAGVFVLKADPTFIRCRFLENVADLSGAGLHFEGPEGVAPLKHVVLINCEFRENVTVDDAAGTGGGAAILYATYEITNTIFMGNTSRFLGGGLYTLGVGEIGDEGFITNCTFVENHAFFVGGGVWGFGLFLDMNIDNCILWGNIQGQPGQTVPSQIVNGGANVNYSNVEGGFDGTGNIDVEPNFGPGDDNFRLAAGSAGIDAGDNDAVPCDEFDVDDNGEDCDAPAQDTPDLDLRERRIDDPDTSDTGNGDSPIVDMGAYEFVPCPWDLSGDCMVGVPDLLLLLAAWGPNPGDPADFDGNGDVGVNDLLILLANWGNCPCGVGAGPLSLPEELADACLSDDNWDAFEAVMMDPNASQEDKDRYLCWMEHYLFHCNKCTCTHRDHCPDPDPFSA